SCVCCEDWAPGWRTFWYSRSSKTARDFLKPLVLTLARLFEMTSRLVCCASRPVLAMYSERIMVESPNGNGTPVTHHEIMSQQQSSQSEDLGGFRSVILGVLQHAHLCFERTC